MEEKIKQRLIGVLVIIGALFIILPFLFHNSRPMVSQKISANIPNSSASSSVNLTLPIATPATAAPSTVAPTTTTLQDTATVAEATTPTEPAAENTAKTTETAPTQVVQSESTTAATETAMSSAPSVAVDQTSQAVVANTAVNKTATASNAVVSNTAVPTTVASNTAPLVKSAVFSGSAATSSALTTGQANEGPVQATQPSTATTQLSDSVSSATATPSGSPAHRHVMQHHSVVKPAMHLKREAWAIQLGVFSDKKNANHLMSKLRAAHYEVYSHSVKHGHQTLLAVFVGPEVNLHKTEMLKQRLKQRFQLNGVVKKYQA